MSKKDESSLRGNRQIQKGIKAMRGRPLIYGEVKQKKWYTLTPSVIEVIRQRAERQGLTESEALERLIRYLEGLPIPKLEEKSDQEK